MEYLYKTDMEDADGKLIEMNCVAMPRVDGDVTLFLENGNQVVLSPEEFKECCRKV